MPFFKVKNSLIYFVHIPKNGGTTIEDLIQSKYEMSFLQSELSEFLIIPPQHLDRKMCSYLGVDKIVDKSFCIVRDPIERYVSAYFYKKKQMAFYFNIFDLDTFTYYVSKRYPNNSYLFDNHIKPQSEYLLKSTKIYHFENGFDAIFKDICYDYDLDISDLKVKHSNKSQRKGFKISNQSKIILNEIYKRDFYDFKYDCFKVEERVFFDLVLYNFKGILASLSFDFMYKLHRFIHVTRRKFLKFTLSTDNLSERRF